MKKGIANVLLVLILALVSLLVVFIILRFFNEEVQQSFDYDECSRSVERYLWTVRFTDNEDLPTIKCPTYIRYIEENDAELIKHKMAEDMRLCYAAFKKGDPNAAFFAENGVYCHPCAIYHFSEEVDSFDGYSAYLRDTYVPGTTSSYLASLLEGGSENAENFDLNKYRPLSDNAIDTEKAYAVIFRHARGKTEVEEIKTEAGGHVVFGLGVGVGTAGIVGGAVLLFTPAGWTAAIIVGVSAGTIALIDSFSWGEQAHWSGITLREWTPDTLNEMKCTYSDVSQDAFGIVS